MKIRNGFVSNSSSSSFMVLAPQETINTAIQASSLKYRKFLRQNFVVGSKKCVLNGIEYRKRFDTYYTESWYDDWPHEDAENEFNEDEAWEAINCFFENLGEPSEIHQY